MKPDEILHTVKHEPARVAGEGYLRLWNDDEQRRIDRDIEAHRMVGASGVLAEIPKDAEVEVEQVGHDFVFGAHLFNFDQLGTDARNERYRRVFGELFNSATIPFYWKVFEPEEGRPRFERHHRDTAAFWNSVEEPETQPHWRRPATDPLVEFCEEKGIRCHGHTLVWGSARWHAPQWIFDKIPACYRETATPSASPSAAPTIPRFEGLSASEIEALIPEYTRDVHAAMARRIAEIALRYKGRIRSWDVVNESATDFGRGNIPPGEGLCKSWYGLMPGDYPYRAFKIAEAYLPPEALLNINDYNDGPEFAAEILHLKSRGCRIDVAGLQMHLFDPEACRAIVAGTSDRQSPENVRSAVNRVASAGAPIHLSEITITAPGESLGDELAQAVIARNLYRLWFSLEPMMGITWWNMVDGCGAPGEPSRSGLFTRDMKPKAAYHVIEDLIAREWRTRLTVRAGQGGRVEFRGFPGAYRLRWAGGGYDVRTLDCRLDPAGRLTAVGPER